MAADKTTNKMYQVGKSIPKIDAKEKVLGQAQYIADLIRPNMLFGAMLQSPYAHAKIISYDTSEAEKVPGVKCVLTGDDFEDHKMGPFIKDEGAIAKGKVRYMGEPVACVAAEDEATARAAALLIDVEYEELPAVLSPEAALEPGAAVLHEELADYFKVFEAIAEDNLMSYTEISEGDVDKAWDECDLIVENTYETQAQNHLSLEPCGALAEVEPDGLINLWSANQSVFRVQANVCECLGLPMSRLRSMTPKVGAGFGNKMEAHIQPLCVALALASKRPVKMILSREEDFETVRARHPFKVRCKTGVMNDGTFVAREVELLVDGGAFADDSPGVLGNAALMSMGPYHFPNAKAFGKVAYTNHLRFAAFRGFGNPQVTFAGEAQL
ncbi:MAG: molybdopterin-dependent oxidoreductase, partial [Rhodospirillaceae bacterium]|nr:molybdopterin-dependent oxidoreductase [Rhodospirillaceae bacterium]